MVLYALHSSAAASRHDHKCWLGRDDGFVAVGGRGRGLRRSFRLSGHFCVPAPGALEVRFVRRLDP